MRCVMSRTGDHRGSPGITGRGEEEVPTTLNLLPHHPTYKQRETNAQSKAMRTAETDEPPQLLHGSNTIYNWRESDTASQETGDRSRHIRRRNRRRRKQTTVREQNNSRTTASTIASTIAVPWQWNKKPIRRSDLKVVSDDKANYPRVQ